MQLGTRWSVGDAPHHSVPEALHTAIFEQERLHPEATSWTLTWLEGRPRVALDTVVTLTLTAQGEPVIEGESSGFLHDEHEDEWLN